MGELNYMYNYKSDFNYNFEIKNQQENYLINSENGENNDQAT